jgi:hypothetical protein
MVGGRPLAKPKACHVSPSKTDILLAAPVSVQHEDFDLPRPLHKHLSPYAYGTANISRLAMETKRQPAGPQWFAPLNASGTSWLGHVFASQYPHDCQRARFLLFEDDISAQGFGYSLNFYVAVLLMAMADNRVLLEVPVDPSWKPLGGGRNTSYITWNASHAYTRVHRPASRPRWCSRRPFTLACFYQPLSHCGVPHESEHVAPHMHARWPRVTTWWPDRRRARVIRVKLSWIFCSWFLWAGKSSLVSRAAIRFLLRTREWVRSRASCVLRHSGLVPRRFVSVHVRDSVEKRRELSRHGHSMPTVKSLHDLAAVAHQALAQSDGEAGGSPRTVVVHTSSAEALSNIIALARASGRFNLTYTDNPRGGHDRWGGWATRGGDDEATMEGAINSVNAELASRAAVLVTPTFSSWSTMLKTLLGASRARTHPAAADDPDADAEVISYCCSCSKREANARSGNIDVMIAADVVDLVRVRLRRALLSGGSAVRGCKAFLKLQPSAGLQQVNSTEHGAELGGQLKLHK